MNIHEYQSKAILRSYGVNVPTGKPAFSVEEAVENARELGTDTVVVKAQIHAGGRGKAGGVKVVHSLEAVEKAAEELLGKVRIRPVLPASVSTACSLRQEQPSRRNTTFPLSLTARRRASS